MIASGLQIYGAFRISGARTRPWEFRPRSIRPDNGAPLRLYSPVKLGYKMTKYLSGVIFTAERPAGYWEDQGYPWLGGI